MAQSRRRPEPAKSKAEKDCKLSCCRVSEQRKEEIRVSAGQSRGKSMFDGLAEDNRYFGVMCRCGIPRKPSGLAKHVEDDGLCFVHPDKPPQSWVRGAEGRDQ